MGEPGIAPTSPWALVGVVVLCVMCTAGPGWAQGFVGSRACADCHAEEYERFEKNSKKAHSWDRLATMASKLTKEELEGCYECHTTGYGKGGFVSHEKTPHLADVGCETCHGPGGDHVDAGGDPEAIHKTPDLATCTGCHNEARVGAFGFKPLIHSGAH